MDLNNPKDKESVQETLKLGIKTDFWKLILQALDDSVEHLNNLKASEDFKDLPPDRYKLESEIVKAKKEFLEKLKGMPTTLINYLESPNDNSDEGEENFDPYY